MTAPHADQIIAGYMARLEAALAIVPPARRMELIDEFRAHIAEARSGRQSESDADLLNILDRLGDPAETAAAEVGRVDPPMPTATKSRGLEIAALVLLLFFWPVGVVLLWISDVWTTRQKLIGTLAPPGGYFALLFIGPLLAWGGLAAMCTTVSDETGRILSSNCPSDGSQAVIDIGLAIVVIFYVLGPILSAVYLATRLRRSRQVPTPPGPDQTAPPLVEATGSP